MKPSPAFLQLASLHTFAVSSRPPRLTGCSHCSQLLNGSPLSPKCEPKFSNLNGLFQILIGKQQSKILSYLSTLFFFLKIFCKLDLCCPQMTSGCLHPLQLNLTSIDLFLSGKRTVWNKLVFELLSSSARVTSVKSQQLGVSQ